MLRIRTLLASLVLLMVLGAPLGAQVLDENSYDRYRSFLEPKADEVRWQSLAWIPTLWDAVIEAHRAKKPILLWAMNGHPLGCT